MTIYEPSLDEAMRLRLFFKRAYFGFQKSLFRNPFKPILECKRAYFAFPNRLFGKMGKDAFQVI